MAKTYKPRCSGYKVFPSGIKCKGCPDCGSKTNKNTPVKYGDVNRYTKRKK